MRLCPGCSTGPFSRDTLLSAKELSVSDGSSGNSEASDGVESGGSGSGGGTSIIDSCTDDAAIAQGGLCRF